MHILNLHPLNTLYFGLDINPVTYPFYTLPNVVKCELDIITVLVKVLISNLHPLNT